MNKGSKSSKKSSEGSDISQNSEKHEDQKKPETFDETEKINVTQRMEKVEEIEKETIEEKTINTKLKVVEIENSSPTRAQPVRLSRGRRKFRGRGRGRGKDRKLGTREELIPENEDPINFNDLSEIIPIQEGETLLDETSEIPSIPISNDETTEIKLSPNPKQPRTPKRAKKLTEGEIQEKRYLYLQQHVNLLQDNNNHKTKKGSPLRRNKSPPHDNLF